MKAAEGLSTHMVWLGATLRFLMADAPEFPSDARRPPTREEHFVLEDLPPRERMLFGALAYVFFPAPLWFARWDPFVRFHVRQGIAIWIGWGLARMFDRFAYRNEFPEVSWLGYLLVTLLMCSGIRNALSVEWRTLPVVGRFADRLPLPKRLAEPPVRRPRAA